MLDSPMKEAPATGSSATHNSARRAHPRSGPWLVPGILFAILALAGCSKESSGNASPSTQAPAAVATTSEAPPAAASELDPIVDAYRKIIVLAEDEKTLGLEEQKLVPIAGLILYQENHQRLSILSQALVDELQGDAPLVRTTAFLDTLEESAELHDADKLAFADVVAELADAASASDAKPQARALSKRLDDDRKALAEIKALYNKELDRIFGRFETRGMTVRREAWESYVAALRAKYNCAAILAEHADDFKSIATAKREHGTPDQQALVISGAKLPKKTLVLTFDDGPHAKYTERIREILKKYDVPAVFFEVGQNVGTTDARNRIRATKAAAASQRLLASGFVLANHSYSHAFLPKLSDAEIAGQIEETDRMLSTIEGAPRILFRPPYGADNERLLAALRAHGMTSVLWNIDSKDWADPVPQSIANRVIQEAEGEGRGIILFHDIHSRTIDALPPVIETLQSRGYKFVGWNGHAFEAPASSAPVVEEPPAPAPKLYRESWAVVIGIDAYAKWPHLQYAANDARAMRELLVGTLGFKENNVTLLLNEDATREKILTAIGDALSDPSKVDREDRVFVFFAGHGATRALPNGKALGYIIPVNADLANYQGQAISMTNFQDISDSIPAKHVFFLTDACYSGIAATRGGGLNYLQEITRRSARQILTAGGANEQVADNGPNGHSIFTWTVMQGLEGRADLNGDGYITASELAAYVGPVVSSLSHQTPAFASLPGSEGGEFIFELQHQNEYLNDESSQLDAEAISLNGELDRIRAEIAAKKARNEKLKGELATAKAELDGVPAAPPPSGKPLTSAQQNDLGMTLFREKRYDDALKAFREAARLNPSSALAANNVGFTYFKLGQHEKAIDWFTTTLKLDPKRAVAWINLGDACAALSRTAEARRAYEKFLELQPTSKQAPTVLEKLRALGGASSS